MSVSGAEKWIPACAGMMSVAHHFFSSGLKSSAHPFMQ
jgi:hypothetical protein